ncbi:MAG: endonuclease domain-containing protein [Alphaproteobacteria bacterium]
MTKNKKLPSGQSPSSTLPRGKRGSGDKNAPARARGMSQEQIDAERIFWSAVNGKRFHGYKFFRQFAIGPHYAGFACVTAKLVIDIDGEKHSGGRKDDARTSELRKQGYGILHFSNSDVVKDIESVLHSLLKQLRKAP